MARRTQNAERRTQTAERLRDGERVRESEHVDTQHDTYLNVLVGFHRLKHVVDGTLDIGPRTTVYLVYMNMTSHGVFMIALAHRQVADISVQTIEANEAVVGGDAKVSLKPRGWSGLVLPLREGELGNAVFLESENEGLELALKILNAKQDQISSARSVPKGKK